MRKKLHSTSTIVALAMIFFVNLHCKAQNIIASGNIDRDSISAGQPFNFKLEVKSPDSYIIDWNGIKDSVDNFEIITHSLSPRPRSWTVLQWMPTFSLP